jgi:hypothetical protein
MAPAGVSRPLYRETVMALGAASADGLRRSQAVIGLSGSTPARRPGSVRRTTSVDILLDGDGGLVLRGSARDLHTPFEGAARTLASAALRARVGPDRRLRALVTDPAEPALQALLGRLVASGFRRAMTARIPRHADSGTALHLLLDDLPVAAMIGGLAIRYARGRDGGPDVPGSLPVADVCVAWRRDGPTMRTLRLTGRPPATVGPPAPDLSGAGDPLGWHRVVPLPPRGMRRRRRIDVAAGDPTLVDAMFRDTHVDDTGVERVIHEYALSATVAADSGKILALEATPRVLPYAECPLAAPSARTVCGHAIPLLRNHVEQALFGPASCTHLNDLLRSLADVRALAAGAAR